MVTRKLNSMQRCAFLSRDLLTLTLCVCFTLERSFNPLVFSRVFPLTPTPSLPLKTITYMLSLGQTYLLLSCLHLHAQHIQWLSGPSYTHLKSQNPFYILIKGPMDHKTHGSDCIPVFDSRIGSFFRSAERKKFTTLCFVCSHHSCIKYYNFIYFINLFY